MCVVLWTRWWAILTIWACLGLACNSDAQGIDADHRPIAQVRIDGLNLVPQQLVVNQIRSQPGDPYDTATVERDIVRITHLGRFRSVKAEVSPQDDGSVILTYVVDEQPLLTDVQIVGNKVLSDQKLQSQLQLQAGDPADPFLIDRGKQRIIEAYEGAGYFVAHVQVDDALLYEQGILIYRLREGPRVRIRGFNFEGNTAYPNKQLTAEIKSRTYFPILRKGELSREQLSLDADAIRQFYHDHGYLDAQVGRRIDLSPNEKDATVTFVISEGSRYQVDQVQVEGNTIFPADQIRLNLTLNRGAVFSQQQLEQSRQKIQDLYGKIGYLEAGVQIQRVFHNTDPSVNLRVIIHEGNPTTVGKVSVRGNELTKSKVILRQVRGMNPGRRFDRSGVDRTRQRLANNPLFSQGDVSILGTPDDAVRDVLIEVKEGQTGQISFGVGVGSDAGITGAIDLTQRNFDIADTPESFGEFISGRAFRGAGQFFAINLQPGGELSRYSVSFREPYLLESDFFLDTNVFFFDRDRDDWTERRLGATLGLGQRFGDVWSASVRIRGESVNVGDIDVSAPTDVFAVSGSNLIDSIGLVIGRSTVDSPLFPTRGSKLDLSINQFGLLGGDFTFTRVTGRWQSFFTVDRDFLGRKTVLSFDIEGGYIFQDNKAPFFERFYAGGHRSFRGFEFRGVGPRGIQNNTGTVGTDAVGGQFLFLMGLEYNFPILGDFIRGVVFTDQGTVQNDLGFDQWRVSAGTGLRIKVPFLSGATFGLDVAAPLIKQSGDQTQFISFDLGVPLQ